MCVSPYCYMKSLGTGVNIDDVCIPLLLYADDIVLLAESEKDLQKLLDKLFTWCHKWRMQVNNDKTKIIHFRPKFMGKTDFKFKYGETNIELVTSYRYLGVTLNEHLKKQNLEIFWQTGPVVLWESYYQNII